MLHTVTVLVAMPTKRSEKWSVVSVLYVSRYYRHL
jgi:hypothetical protein